MLRHIRLLERLAWAIAVGLAVAAWAGAAAAQDNPFELGDDTAGAAEVPPDGVAEPAAGAPDESDGDEPLGGEAPPAGLGPPAAPAAAGPALADFARRDPTLAAVLALPRETPAAKFQAVLTLVNMGRHDVAALLLPELLAMQLDDAQRAALVRQFGSASMMKMIRLDAATRPDEPASPLAGLRDFAQKCLDAAAAQARDPARVASLVAQLNAATPEERYAARVDLHESGEVGIIACFVALAQAETPEARENIMAGLAALRPAVDEPLIAVLADADGPLQRDVATLAGRMRMSVAVPWLSAIAVSPGDAADAARGALATVGLPAPTAAEVEQLLRQKIADVKSEPLKTIDEGTVGLWWSWDPATKRLTVREFAPKQLRTLTAARWSRALTRIGGSAAADDARQAVIYELEEAALLGRPVTPAIQQALSGMSPGGLMEALGEALAADLRPAALGLIAELAARGDATVLATSSGRPTPLAAALASPVREIRFAALSAITRLAPATSFPGSSQVAESLWYFAAGAGPPTAVTAAADVIAASDWAGQLRAAKFEAVAVRTGREAMLAAVDPAMCSRLAVVVLDSDIGQPLVGEVIYQLHANQRTAGVPVLVCCSGPRLAAAERIAASDPLVLAVPRPHREGDLASLVEQARALAGRPLPPNEQRTAEAAQAIDWIASLLASGGPYDELHREAGLLTRTLWVPELTASSLKALAALGTSDSQAALVDYASGEAAPAEMRRAAAAAFAASVQRFGLRLTRDEVLRQYDRYNASETADVQTQQLLGQILDVIERKPPAP